MCTRYFIEKDTPEFNDVIDKILKSSFYMKIVSEHGNGMHYRGEIKPTDLVPVIAPNRSGNRSAYPMKWGLSVPGSDGPIINSRIESASSYNLFKESWERRRCIIPASWYYEWEHFKSSDGKTKAGSKYMIQPKGAMSTWLCGLYSYESNLPVFTILTCKSSGEVSKLHDRMPFMLPPDKIDEWINPDSDPKSLLSYAITDLFVGHADDIKDINERPDWWMNTQIKTPSP